MSEFGTIPPKLTRIGWNALLDHGLEKAASFVIRKSGSNYQAINGSTGKIPYSDTDAVSVIQSAVNDCTSGGMIFFKAYSFSINSTITVSKDFMTFCAESGATFVMGSNGQISMAKTGTLFRTTFLNMYFNGASATVPCLSSDAMVDGSNRIWMTEVRDCDFYDFRNSASAVSLKNPEETRIENCRWSGCSNGGYLLKLYSGNYNPGNIYIAENYWEPNWGPNGGTFTCIELESLALGKEFVNVHSRSNHLWGSLTDYANSLNRYFRIYAPTAGDLVKQTKFLNDRIEGGQLLEIPSTTERNIKDGIVSNCYIDIGGGITYGVNLGLDTGYNGNARNWLVHDNHFNVPSGKTGVYDYYGASSNPNMIYDNYFTGSGTPWTVCTTTILRDNLVG